MRSLVERTWEQLLSHVISPRMSEDFELLSRVLQIKVDKAFDAALESDGSIGLSSVKRSKLTGASNSGLSGGFVIESADPPGGFIHSKADNIQLSDDDLIPLSLVPSALQFLDFPPDDEEVLHVFHNAAGGWSGVPRTDGVFNASDEGKERTVTRKDWRAVCAVIIGDRNGEDIAGEFLVDEDPTAFAGVQESLLQEEETGNEKNDEDDEDESYQESSLSSPSSRQVSDSDSDEYTGEPSSSKAKSRSSRHKAKGTSASISYNTPTSRQKRAALDTFALFFPSSPPPTDDDLTTKRLMFKDIVRVAAMLKESIKAEEVEEMLSLFSTSPDKSISLDDFTRLMIIARLAWYSSPIPLLHQAHFFQIVIHIAQVPRDYALIDTRFRTRKRTAGTSRCLPGQQ